MDIEKQAIAGASTTQDCYRGMEDARCVISNLDFLIHSYQQSQHSALATQSSMGCEGMHNDSTYLTIQLSCLILQYLGAIPDLLEWQCPGSRTEFLQLVDQAQVGSTKPLVL